MLLLLACTAATVVDHTPDAGRTSARQLDVARAIIEDGLIPSRAHFTVDGVLAEHRLISSEPEDCQGDCLRAWGAKADPIDGSGAQLLFQVGASDTGPRPKRIVVVVDTSGSIGVTRLEDAVLALTDLSSQLGDDDEMGLVSFNDRARVRMKPKAMDASGRSDFRQALGRLGVGGPTATAEGLRAGYDLLFRDFDPDMDNRLILLTDDRPEQLDTVLRMVRTHAEQGAALHLFALAVDLGADLTEEIESTRGGRYHYVAEAELDTLFQEPLVSPLCTGAKATLALEEGYTWNGTLGFPSIEAPLGDSFRLPTLSADMTPLALLIAGPAPPEGAFVGQVHLDCNESIALQWYGGAEYPFTTLRADDEGVFRMAALWDEAQALDIAAGFCEGDVGSASARTRVRQAADRLRAEAVLLDDDEGLLREAELLDQLAENLDVGDAACL